VFIKFLHIVHLVQRPLLILAYSQYMHYTLCVTTGMEVPKMNRIRWQDRVVIAPDIHHGDACIKGTRIPVAVIVGSLADGMKPREIREAYPQLADEDIQAALAYAAEVIRQDILVPLPA